MAELEVQLLTSLGEGHLCLKAIVQMGIMNEQDRNKAGWLDGCIMCILRYLIYNVLLRELASVPWLMSSSPVVPSPIPQHPIANHLIAASM